MSVSSEQSATGKHRTIEQKVAEQQHAHRDPDVLEYYYIEKGMSTHEVADELGCGSHQTILHWLQKHDIPARDQVEAARDAQDGPWRDEATLHEMYVEERMSTVEIAEELGCGSTTVGTWLKRHDISTRNLSEASSGIDIEELRDGDWLQEQYIENEKSSIQIADEVGCSNGAVLNALRWYDIPVRDRIEASRKARRVNRATHRIVTRGHPIWQVREPDGSNPQVAVHQLLAIADGADPHEVFSGGVNVHHSTGHPALNIPGYVEVLTPSEHAKTHDEGEWTQKDGIPVLVTQRDDGA